MKQITLVVSLVASFAVVSGCSIGFTSKTTEDLQFTMHRYPASAGKDDACVHVRQRLLSIEESVDGSGSKLVWPKLQNIVSTGAACQSDSRPFDPNIVPPAYYLL
jgi:hypothetical protein